MKDICSVVLRDENAGSKLRDELLSRTQDILAYCRAEAREERDAIIDDANLALQEMMEMAIRERKCMCNCDYWPMTLEPFLYRIQKLHERGPLSNAAEMAWGALIQVASLCIHDWDDGELRISGLGEADCDGFHDHVDELMRVICEAQKESENVSWLRNGRMEEIQSLQQEATKKMVIGHTHTDTRALSYFSASSELGVTVPRANKLYLDHLRETLGRVAVVNCWNLSCYAEQQCIFAIERCNVPTYELRHYSRGKI